MNRQGASQDSLVNILLWVIVLILAVASVYFLLKKFGLR